MTPTRLLLIWLLASPLAGLAIASGISWAEGNDDALRLLHWSVWLCGLLVRIAAGALAFYWLAAIAASWWIGDGSVP